MKAQKATRPENTIWSGHRSRWFYLGHWIVGLLSVAATAYAVYSERTALSRWMPSAYGAPLLTDVIFYQIGGAERVRNLVRGLQS